MVYLSPRAARLLKDLEDSHRALIVESGADDVMRHGLRAVYDAFAAAMAGLDEDRLITSPQADEWSMAQVIEHVAEHDRKYRELQERGLVHYVEHGLEHAGQAWRLRLQ
jgi:hypothetical protein